MGFVASVLLVLGSIMLTSCSHYGSGRSQFDRALKTGFTKIRFMTKDFVIYGAIKNEVSHQDNLVVYIEGDGAAWRQNKIPADPTPKQPLALDLALADPAPEVLYLGRPGQFRQIDDPQCRPVYWSLARYSEEIVAVFSKLVDVVKKRCHAGKIGLIGYSGGGVIATLLAARRNDVVWLVTIASNLDHELWCREHNVTPLKYSLEPKKFAEKLQKIPQVHFVGGQDRIVARRVVQSYVNSMPESSSIRIVVEEQFDHHCCWREAWPDLIKMIPGR